MSTLKTGTAPKPDDPRWDNLVAAHIGTVARSSHRADLADDMEYALDLNTHKFEPVGGTGTRRGTCIRCKQQRGWREHLTPHAVAKGAVTRLRAAGDGQ